MPRKPASVPARSPDGPERLPAELVENDFGWALGVILRRYLRVADEIVGDLPGGPRGYQVIATASQNVAMNQGALASHVGVDRTVLTYLIDDLEAAGLVSRQPDPADRRSRRVVATEAGQALCRERRDALARAEAEILSVLGSDQSTFTDLLRRVAVSADRLDPVRNACDLADQLSGNDGSGAHRA